MALKDRRQDPIRHIEQHVPGLSERLFAIGLTSIFDVPRPGQAVLAAIIARHTVSSVWIVCTNVKRQEEVAADLLTWGVEAVIFPELSPVTDTEGVADPEVLSERLEILSRLANGERLVVVAQTDQLDSPVPTKDGFKKDVVELVRGQQRDVPELASSLASAGYERVPKVFARGQFAQRGGIFDVFSWQHPSPIRLEFFDNEIEAIRTFSIDSQISTGPLESCQILLADTDPREHQPLFTYIGETARVVALDLPEEQSIAELVPTPVAAVLTLTEIPSEEPTHPDDESPFAPLPIDALEAGDLVIDEVKRGQFFRQLRDWIAAKWRVVLACNNEGEWERFCELASDNSVSVEAMTFHQGSLSGGMICPSAKLAILSDAEIFGRSASQRAHRALTRRERTASARAAVDYTEFDAGDLVVHLDHGIGRFVGVEHLDGTPVDQERDGAPDSERGDAVLAIEFAESSRLLVPLDQAWQVSRYVGLGKRNPPLSTLGDGKWQRAIKKAERSIFEYAATMLRLQAERETKVGHAFGPDTHWQEEFEASFIHRTTNDQAKAIWDTKRDMESDRPMDRLICGDVGFGKTEVAIRAVFKAVNGGKQVAFLAPTTVLAQQHFQTLRERMSEYPVTIGALHRFRTRAEQKATLVGLAEGSLDIVVGTHRLLSNDVVFKNLGLVVVDEEQRFGVKHKELLKERFRLIDVLTLSATPIPRTLYLALMGARDMSLIETPPANRKPVETIICAYDERVMRDAIARELARGGQVYLLHNRVRTIERLAHRITELVPGAKVAIGHGQMDESDLEETMHRFVRGDVDVLVSTTIIESGLDIPNANTIIIDRADRFGLADLYQLRGRVGRSHHKAYAYLMLPRDLLSTGQARKRVQAIRQYSELGAGFKIAMRDLEIRGAGNILGTAQSGHILAVGFDLYCKMLRRSVATLHGDSPRNPATSTPVRIDLVCTSEAEFAATSEDERIPAFLPTRYIVEPRDRIEAYRKLADSADQAALELLKTEWTDRYGKTPAAVHNLITLQAIKLVAATKRFRSVEVREGKIMIKRRNDDFILFGKKFPRLTSTRPENTLREVLAYLENRNLA